MVRWRPPLTLWMWVSLTFTATSGTMTRNWCYTQEQLPQTLKCYHGNVLTIIEAVPRVHTRRNIRFCYDPAPSGSDCLLPAETDTNHYRRMCNGLESCVFLLTPRPRNTCLGADDRFIFLQMIYTCIPARGKNGDMYPVFRPALSDRGEVPDGEFWLQSSGYPSQRFNVTRTECTVQTDATSQLTLHIIDLSFSTDSPNLLHTAPDCPYYISVRNHSRLCAELGSRPRVVGPLVLTAGRDNVSLTHLQFATSQQLTTAFHGRFWLKIVGFTGNGINPAPMKVTCDNPLSPYAAESISDDGFPIIWIIVPVVLVIIIIIICLIIIGLFVWRLRKRKAKKDQDETCSHEEVGDVSAVPLAEAETSESEKLNTQPADTESEKQCGDEEEKLNKADLTNSSTAH